MLLINVLINLTLGLVGIASWNMGRALGNKEGKILSYLLFLGALAFFNFVLCGYRDNISRAANGSPLHQSSLSNHEIYERVQEPNLVFLKDRAGAIQAYQLDETPPAQIFKVIPRADDPRQKQLVPYPPPTETTPTTEKEK